MVRGNCNCTVECNPLLGPQLFDLVEALIKQRVVINEGVYDQSVAKDLIGKRQY